MGGWNEGKQHGEGKLISGNKVKIGRWLFGDRDGDWIQEITESDSAFDMNS